MSALLTLFRDASQLQPLAGAFGIASAKVDTAGDSAGLWKSGFMVSGTGHFPTALGQLLGKPRTCPHCPQHDYDYYFKK